MSVCSNLDPVKIGHVSGHGVDVVVGDVQGQQGGQDVDAVFRQLDQLVVGQVQGQQPHELAEVLRQLGNVVVAEVEVYQIGGQGQPLTEN